MQPANGIVVLRGKADTQGPFQFYFFNLDESEEVERVWDLDVGSETCANHGRAGILGLEVENKNMVAVACYDCGDIKLMKPSSCEVSVVFQYKDFKPYRMCHGDPGKMWVCSLKAPFSVVELDCSSMAFTLTGREIHPGIKLCTGLSFVPAPFNALVITQAQDHLVVAVSCETNEKLWEVFGDNFIPAGVVFSPTHQMVLVADQYNSPRNRDKGIWGSVQIIDPSDGSRMKKVDLDDTPSELYLLGRDCLIMISADHRISYFLFLSLR